MIFELSLEALINLAILVLLLSAMLAFAVKSFRESRRRTLDSKKQEIIDQSIRYVADANSVYAKRMHSLSENISEYEISLTKAAGFIQDSSEREYSARNEMIKLMSDLSSDIANDFSRTSEQFQLLQETIGKTSEEIARSSSQFRRVIDESEYVERYLRERPANSTSEILQQIDSLAATTESLKKELHESLVFSTMGMSPSRSRQKRYAPLRVYISEEDFRTVDAVERSLTYYAASFGFVPVEDYPPEGGSWFKRWIAKSQRALSAEEVRDIFRKGQRSIELSTLDKKRAEVNRENALAAGEFLRAIENVDKVAAQFGSLLIVKRMVDGESSIVTRVLTEFEMELIENNQIILKDANSLLDRLSEAADRAVGFVDGAEPEE